MQHIIRVVLRTQLLLVHNPTRSRVGYHKHLARVYVKLHVKYKGNHYVWLTCEGCQLSNYLNEGGATRLVRNVRVLID